MGLFTGDGPRGVKFVKQKLGWWLPGPGGQGQLLFCGSEVLARHDDEALEADVRAGAGGLGWSWVTRWQVSAPPTYGCTVFS